MTSKRSILLKKVGDPSSNTNFIELKRAIEYLLSLTTVDGTAVFLLVGTNNIGTDRLWGRDTPAFGPQEEIAVTGGLEFSGVGAIQRSALTGDVAAAAGSGTTTIANDAVSNAKAANMPANTLKGNNTGGITDPSDLTVAQVNTMLGVSPFVLIQHEQNISPHSYGGSFDITGLAGLTAGRDVLIRQKAGPYTGKGTQEDEAEMDLVVATGYVVNATTIRVYWNCAQSNGPVAGNIKFGYIVSA